MFRLDPALTNGTTLNDNEPKAALPYPQRLMSSMPPTEESSDSFQSISDDEDDNNGEMAIQDRKPIAIDVRSASWRVKVFLIFSLIKKSQQLESVRIWPFSK